MPNASLNPYLGRQICLYHCFNLFACRLLLPETLPHPRLVNYSGRIPRVIHSLNWKRNSSRGMSLLMKIEYQPGMRRRREIHKSPVCHSKGHLVGLVGHRPQGNGKSKQVKGTRRICNLNLFDIKTTLLLDQRGILRRRGWIRNWDTLRKYWIDVGAAVMVQVMDRKIQFIIVPMNISEYSRPSSRCQNVVS